MKTIPKQPNPTAETTPVKKTRLFQKYKSWPAKHKNLARFIGAGALLVSAALLCLIASYTPNLVERIFTPVSRVISGLLGRIWSLVPRVPVGEILLVSGVLAALTILVVGAVKRHFMQSLSKLTLTATVLILFFVSVWGLNYYKAPLAQRLDAPVREYSEQELMAAAEYYLSYANQYATIAPRDADGVFDMGSFDGVSPACVDAVKKLDEVPGWLVCAPKAMVSSVGFSYLGILGIYNPFTGECNVNYDQPDLDLAFTTAHEMAHRLAYAPENEANYIAFLTCIGADSAGLRYSGWYNAFSYCYNRLSGENQTLLRAQISDPIWTDLADRTAHYQQYEGKAQSIANDINDGYLKFFGQEDGVRSYGEVVDLLIAYHQTSSE